MAGHCICAAIGCAVVVIHVQPRKSSPTMAGRRKENNGGGEGGDFASQSGQLDGYPGAMPELRCSAATTLERCPKSVTMSGNGAMAAAQCEVCAPV